MVILKINFHVFSWNNAFYHNTGLGIIRSDLCNPSSSIFILLWKHSRYANLCLIVAQHCYKIMFILIENDTDGWLLDSYLWVLKYLSIHKYLDLNLGAYP